MLSKFVNQDQVLACTRWLFSVGGGYMLGRGWITADQLSLIGGVAVPASVLIWSFIAHTDAAKVKAAAIPGVEILVQPDASAALKQIADDPLQPKVVRQ